MALGMLAAAAPAPGQSSRTKPPATANLDRAIPIQTEKWTGDLGGMAKRRVIRVLVVYSKMFYFVDRGQQRGVTYDAMQIFEKYVNQRLRTGTLPVRIVFYPVDPDQIIPMLRDGRGDIAAANLTMTPDRERLVDFSSAILSGINQIVVTGPSSRPIQAPH